MHSCEARPWGSSAFKRCCSKTGNKQEGPNARDQVSSELMLMVLGDSGKLDESLRVSWRNQQWMWERVSWAQPGIASEHIMWAEVAEVRKIAVAYRWLVWGWEVKNERVWGGFLLGSLMFFKTLKSTLDLFGREAKGEAAEAAPGPQLVLFGCFL